MRQVLRKNSIIVLSSIGVVIALFSELLGESWINSVIGLFLCISLFY